MSKDVYDAAVESFMQDARVYAATLIENGEMFPEMALKTGMNYALAARKRDAKLFASLPAPDGNVVPIRPAD